MLDLEEIKRDMELVNDIDWDMTPEEAVTLYLEWGNNWSHGKNLVRSENDVSHYFVVNTWDEPPRIYLIRRNSAEARELGVFFMPEDMSRRFLRSVGHRKGVYKLNQEIRTWLQNILYSHPDRTLT
jgi:hypothetical protein